MGTGLGARFAPPRPAGLEGQHFIPFRFPVLGFLILPYAPRKANILPEVVPEFVCETRHAVIPSRC